MLGIFLPGVNKSECVYVWMWFGNKCFMWSITIYMTYMCGFERINWSEWEFLSISNFFRKMLIVLVVFSGMFKFWLKYIKHENTLNSWENV